MQISQISKLITTKYTIFVGLLFFIALFVIFFNSYNRNNYQQVAGVVEKNDDLSNTSLLKDLLVDPLSFKQYVIPNFKKSRSSQEIWPYFKVGNYWLYQFDYKEMEVETQTVNYRSKNIKTEVIDLIENEKLKASLIINFPLSDLTSDNSLTTIVFMDDKYYFINGSEVFDQIKNNFTAIPDLSDYVYYPKNLANLEIGSKWLAEDNSRTDNYYRYFIEDIVNTALYKKIIISYYTLPEKLTTEVIPGIGISQDYYVHQGTISEHYLKLTDFKIN